MFKKVFFMSVLTISTMCLFAQNNQEVKYRRSSLSMILITSDEFPNKEAVMSSWNSYPFPDKYNRHEISLTSVDAQLTDEELTSRLTAKDTLTNKMEIFKEKFKRFPKEPFRDPFKYLTADSSVAVLLPTEKQAYQWKIDAVIKEQQVAKQLVASWFNRQPNGSFNMELIQDRGQYNATEMDVAIAQGQARGLASIADAGEELINNTFVTFTKLEFVENEPIATAIRNLAYIVSGYIPNPIAQVSARTAADIAYLATHEGFSLWTKTWLYKLVWNDSVQSVFYNELWNNPQAFDEADLFQLELVGVQYNSSLVTTQWKATELAQYIDKVLVRNMDRVFAELQKDNDVFKPKCPILTASPNPISAEIGMKEGLKGGEKFKIMEMTMDENGRTKYVQVGVATVDKKQVWDNRYKAGEGDEKPQLDKEGKAIKTTLFKGPKSAQSGMLLKQIK
jgi:hypothetical protein